MLTEWERKRSAFNHDWMKNIYLRNLMGALDRLQLAPDSPIIIDYLDSDFSAWEHNRDKVCWLSKNLSESLSPKRLFESRPLSLVSADTRAWLPDAVHHIWLAKYNVKEAVSRLNILIDTVDEQYKNIKKILDNNEGKIKREVLKYCLETYQTACRDLSNNLSSLPKTIRTV